jgi:hypothetical protein
MARIRPSSRDIGNQYAARYGRDRLILEIEKRAFHSILSLLPKSRSPLEMWNVGLGKEEKLLQMTRARKIPVICAFCLSSSPARFLKECHHFLRHEGRILVGFIPQESPWGRFYAQTEKRRHSSYRWGRLYSLKRMEHMMMNAGFSIQGYFSTLFQKPGAVKDLENPMRGYRPQAGFLILIGKRREF